MTANDTDEEMLESMESVVVVVVDGYVQLTWRMNRKRMAENPGLDKPGCGRCASQRARAEAEALSLLRSPPSSVSLHILHPFLCLLRLLRLQPNHAIILGPTRLPSNPAECSRGQTRTYTVPSTSARDSLDTDVHGPLMSHNA